MEERGLEAHFTGDDGLNSLSDGKLRTEDGGCFHIHKFFLAKNNNYFYALFCGIGRDKNNFVIPGIKGEVLNNILSYIYSGIILITNENYSELMIASDYLMVDDILTEVKKFMKNNLSINNCIPFLVAGLTIDRADFVKENYRFVQTNFERVVHNERMEIVDLPFEAFELLLSGRSLCVRSEMTAFISIVKWVSFDSSKRKAFVPHLIKYPILSPIDEDSATDILQHDIIAENTTFQHLNNKSSFSSSFEFIKSYIQSLHKPEFPIKRIPTKLNCILLYEIRKNKFRFQTYLTYDEQIDLWRKISGIDISALRWDFSLCNALKRTHVMVHGKDGKLSVFFDSANNEWRTCLPYGYDFSEDIVLQDLFTVFDDTKSNPPLFHGVRWERIESSPLSLQSFVFYPIDKEEYIDILTRQNRHPDVHFEKSPFAQNQR